MRLGELASTLIELLLEVGCRGTATARSRRLLAALDLRRLPAACLHCYATRRRVGLASGHATNAIDVTTGHPLIKPSYDAQDHARGSERYHTSEGIERGLDRVRARARNAPILLPLGPRWVANRQEAVRASQEWMVVQSVCLGYRGGWAFNEPASFMPWRRAATKAFEALNDEILRNPTTGIADCCACAASSHATAAPLRRLMNSRRRMSAPNSVASILSA